MRKQFIFAAALAAAGCALTVAAEARGPMRSGGPAASRGGATTPSRFRSPGRSLSRSPVSAFPRTPGRSLPRKPVNSPPRMPVRRPGADRTPKPMPESKPPRVRPGREVTRTPRMPRKPTTGRMPIRRPGAEILKKIKTAGPLPIKGGGKHGFKPLKDYHLKCGKKFWFGYCYSGKHHCHWSDCCWWDSYGCYVYWCPSICVWYYWCEPDECFYPVTYCPDGCYVY